MAYEIPWGIVNMSSDTDNVIRKYDLFELHDDRPYYSIGVTALANTRLYQADWEKHIHLGNKLLRVSDRNLPLQTQNKAAINYYGPAGTFTTISSIRSS